MEELVCESTLCGKPWKVHGLPALGESLATTPDTPPVAQSPLTPGDAMAFPEGEGH